MAKSGFWLRGAKGKLAGSTIYRSKSGTVIREVVSPTNPKTKGQMKQRAIFATCVKFFKHANQRFFKFAFEDKKSNESDYNAFVRHNIKNSTIYAYDASQNGAFPAIAPWQLSQGSLSAANVSIENDRLVLFAEGITTEMTNLGQVWEKVIEQYNLQAGDIITMVAIKSIVNSIDDVEVSTEPTWDTYQFYLDPSDTTALGDVFAVAENHLTMETSMSDDDACGAAVVFSRNIAGGGLKCSTSSLVINDVAERIYVTSLDDSYREEALNSWGAKGEAILQGSIVGPRRERVVEPTFIGFRGASDNKKGGYECPLSDVGSSLEINPPAGVKCYVKVEGSNLQNMNPDLLDSDGLTFNSLGIETDATYGTFIYLSFSAGTGNNGEVSYDGETLFTFEV